MKLLWMDLEMSGLDVQACRILETAVIVTDLALNELETYEAIVYQPPEVLAGMDGWCREHHGKSGLTKAVASGKPETLVEDELLALIERHFAKDDKPVLCGNSISNDRDFVRAYWPRLAARLHYRLVDVSSFKVIFKERFGVKHEKAGAHRAVGDIRESIDELKHYLSFLDLQRLPRPG